MLKKGELSVRSLVKVGHQCHPFAKGTLHGTPAGHSPPREMQISRHELAGGGAGNREELEPRSTTKPLPNVTRHLRKIKIKLKTGGMTPPTQPMQENKDT